MKLKLLGITAVLLAGCAATTVGPMSVPLQYKMMAAPAEFSAQQSCSGLSGIEVKDSRTEQKLGIRYLENKNSEQADVTAGGDVAAWVRSGTEAGLKQAGVGVGSADHGTLRLAVDMIKTDENVFRRSGYSGRITLLGEITKGAKSCWKGQVSGKGENYGYSGSVENYQETLNHALDRAVIDLLDNAEFRKATCSC